MRLHFIRGFIVISGAILLAACGSTPTSTMLPGNNTLPTATPESQAPAGPLTITLNGQPITQAQPGETLPLALAGEVCCVVYEPYAGGADWSVEPADFASVDGAGVLSIHPDVPPGTVLTVMAVVKADGQIVNRTITIYTPQANPLVGKWSEEVQYACDTGEPATPPSPIKELVFKADQSLTATWFPFEAYADYWGHYSFDLASGNFGITVDGGNYVPADFDGEGTFRIDEQGGLVLTNIWLGTPPPHGAAGPVSCGHRFVR